MDGVHLRARLHRIGKVDAHRLLSRSAAAAPRLPASSAASGGRERPAWRFRGVSKGGQIRKEQGKREWAPYRREGDSGPGEGFSPMTERTPGMNTRQRCANQ